MDINDFERMLPIDKHRLDEELEVQAEVQWRIAERLAKSNADRDDLKDVYERVRAEVAEDVLLHTPGLAAAKVDAKVIVTPRRIRGWEDYLESKKVSERWYVLHEAWRARGFALKSLCDLSASNYFAVDSHTVQSLDVKEARAALHRERRASTLNRQRTSAPESKEPIRRRAVMS